MYRSNRDDNGVAGDKSTYQPKGRNLDDKNKRSSILDLLFLLFGVSAWAAINGLWVQTPILVQHLPEAWKLASYIVVLTQIANLGPVGYTILRKFIKSDRLETCSIHVIMAIGVVACLLLAVYWDTITTIGGSKHSVVFLVLTGALAFVDCTSSVLYLPFVAHFKPLYIRSLLIGEGFSGLIPSLVSLMQGVGGNPTCTNHTIENNGTLGWKMRPVYPEPRFSVSAFFVFLTLLMVASWIAFWLINYLDLAKQERSIELRKQVEEDEKGDINSLLSFSEMSKPCFFSLLLIQSYCCCLMNGVLAAISTYSTLPYGNITYHLSTNLSVISGPVACFLVFVFHKKDFQRPVLPLTMIGTVGAAYIIVVAASSPRPPLQDSSAGSFLIIAAWLLFHGSFSYVKACIAGTMRSCSFGGHRALFYYGVFTQIGSFVGAIVMFGIVNFTHSFKTYNPCG